MHHASYLAWLWQIYESSEEDVPVFLIWKFPFSSKQHHCWWLEGVQVAFTMSQIKTITHSPCVRSIFFYGAPWDSFKCHHFWIFLPKSKLTPRLHHLTRVFPAGMKSIQPLVCQKVSFLQDNSGEWWAAGAFRGWSCHTATPPDPSAKSCSSPDGADSFTYQRFSRWVWPSTLHSEAVSVWGGDKK